jgi:hypothetical protein
MKKYIKWGIVGFAIGLLILTIEIVSVPDYRGGESYVSYSPDGKYRLDLVYPQNNARSLRIITSLNDGKVKAIVPLSVGFEGSINPIFLCNSDNSRCYQHILGVDEEILPLPPLPWTRLHAWLVIKLNHLEEPNLKMMRISKWYPPVTKESK